MTSPDGYITKLHRILGKDGKIGTKGPVLFSHGLTGSSSTWISVAEEYSPAWMTVNEGYDCWFLNNRGNAYGLKHEVLSIDSDEFWDSDFD